MPEIKVPAKKDIAKVVNSKKIKTELEIIKPNTAKKVVIQELKNQKKKIEVKTEKSNVVKPSIAAEIKVLPAKSTVEKVVLKKVKTEIVEPTKRQIIPKPKLQTKKTSMVVTFQLKFSTTYGQQLFITGNHELLGNGDVNKALPMQYFNEEFWYASIDFTTVAAVNETIIYNIALVMLYLRLHFPTIRDCLL